MFELLLSFSSLLTVLLFCTVVPADVVRVAPIFHGPINLTPSLPGTLTSSPREPSVPRRPTAPFRPARGLVRPGSTRRGTKPLAGRAGSAARGPAYSRYHTQMIAYQVYHNCNRQYGGRGSSWLLCFALCSSSCRLALWRTSVGCAAILSGEARKADALVIGVRDDVSPLSAADTQGQRPADWSGWG